MLFLLVSAMRQKQQNDIIVPPEAGRTIKVWRSEYGASQRVISGSIAPARQQPVETCRIEIDAGVPQPVAAEPARRRRRLVEFGIVNFVAPVERCIGQFDVGGEDIFVTDRAMMFEDVFKQMPGPRIRISVSSSSLNSRCKASSRLSPNSIAPPSGRTPLMRPLSSSTSAASNWSFRQARPITFNLICCDGRQTVTSSPSIQWQPLISGRRLKGKAIRATAAGYRRSPDDRRR